MSTTSPSNQDIILCPHCQKENRAQARFCMHCGFALQTPSPSHEGFPSSFKALQPGVMLENGYKIIKKLGESEQGRVFLAQDASGRLYALKQVRELYAQERLEEYNQYIRSFQREAQILSSLPHPYLPIARDFLPDEYLIVMDYIEGTTLAEILNNAQAPLPESKVIRWAVQVCEALRYLHEKKPPIIHRNITPQNIILEQSPDEHVRLLGFGMARYYLPGLERDEEIMVSPGYSPPEQYGSAQTDPRSDLFSLGATMFTLLTKHSLSAYFQTDDQGEVTFHYPGAQRFNPALSKDICQALEKALQAAPKNRFQSAAEMKAALEAIETQKEPEEKAWRFTLGEAIPLEETVHYEFKEILEADVKTAIKRQIETYVVAFLNRDGGSIFWGIRDNDRTVVGIELNYHQRDEIRRLITDKLLRIQPSVPLSHVHILFHEVHQDDRVLPNRYVIEVKVEKPQTRLLYFTSLGEVFIKTEAGKKKLNGAEIQAEVLRRLKQSEITRLA